MAPVGGQCPSNARVVVLTAALLAYALGSMWLSEAGIAAAAIAGIVLGNAEIPHKEEVAGFKGGITLFVLSFVFIVLAAQLSLGDLRALGVGGLVVVIVVAALVRPLAVLSTLGGRLTVRERMFVGGMGPRGIVPASVATLFAIELRPENPEAATVLVGTVFLVIFATVMFQGGLARHFAQALDILPMQTLIVGGGRVGRELAVRYESRGEEVVLIDSDEDTVERTRADGHRVVHGDATNATVLEEAGANRASVVVAATADDDVNLLVAQLATTRFDVDTVVARANQPDNVEAFEDLDVETISAGFAVADAIDDAVSDQRWSTAVGLRPNRGRTGSRTQQRLTGRPDHRGNRGEASERLSGRNRESQRHRQSPRQRFRLARGDHLDARRGPTKRCGRQRLCQGGYRTARPLSAVRRARRSPNGPR